MQLRMAEATPSEADSSDGEAAAGSLASGCCLDFSRVCSTRQHLLRRKTAVLPPNGCCQPGGKRRVLRVMLSTLVLGQTVLLLN